MSESEKSPTNTPTIVVVILAMLGLAAFPQGGGKISEVRPKVEAIAAGDASAVEDAKDEDDLGPLATLKADRLPEKLEFNGLSEKQSALLRAEHGLRFLIVLVPDPDHTSMSHEFDLTLSAALRATESAGFVATRWSGMPGFPPTRKDASQDGTNPAVARVNGTAAGKGGDPAVDNKSSSLGLKWPAAVLLSRPTKNSDSDPSIRLLTLLVPESPTQGVNKERLVAAIDLIDTHGRLHEACVHTDGCHHVPCTYQPVRIVGPSFSGSMSSFAKVLLHFIPDAPHDPPPAKMPRFVIYNGRSTSPDLHEQFLKKQPGAIRFKSTVYTNRQMGKAVRKYLKTITPAFAAPPRFAVLVESNTGFGQGSKKPRFVAEFFSFPLNISRIREEYAAKGYFSSNERVKLQSPNRLSPLEMAGVRGQHDLIPVVSPGPSAVVGELQLSQTILALERGHFNWVAILATNPYDRLFLAEQVRLACSDTRLYLVSASTLYAHHTATPYLRGAIVASTYPLDPVSQTWTASPGWREKQGVAQLSFGNDYDEGIYNATIAHLSDLKLDRTPDLLDYAYPGADSKPNAVPSVWISVVGQRSLYPVQVQPPEKDWIAAPDPKYPEVGGLYTAPENQPPPEEMKKAKLDSNWTAILITAAFASIVLSLWYLRVILPVDKTSRVGRWTNWAVASPGVREVIDHHSARKLAAAAASAGLGLMILFSAPVWVLLWPDDIHVATTPFQSCLMIGISVLALLGLGASSVAALFRMLFADRDHNVGLGESIYRGIVAALALAQVALPFYLVVSMRWLDAANLRLCFVRTTCLVNGVTPLIPFLLLGVAGGVVMIGDWLRVGLRVKMNATGEVPGLSSGPLSAVWSGFKETRRALDMPLTAWRDAGFLATLPLWVILALMGVVLGDGMPKGVEPYPMFLYSFMLVFAATLGLLVVRLVDLMGLLPRIDWLLRQLAEIPMVRAFDRIPALFATENFWRHRASATLAEADTNPRIDRQFEAVVVGYQSNLQAIRTEKRLSSVDLEPLDNLLRTCSSTDRLPTKQWWPAVDALTPLLAPFWASRPAIPGPTESDKKSSGNELADWPGVENQELRTWLRSAEDLVAMVMVRQLAWLRASVQLTISFLVAGLVITFLVLNSYPFEPQEPIFALLGVLTVITVGSIVVIAVQASRDEVLSRLNKTPVDRFSFDRHFLTTMITFVVPLLGLLGALSYSLSDLFRSLFEPFFRGG